MWFLLLYIFIRIEFGLVYIISSLLYFIFANLGKRREGELSAYHVFNKDFKALPGQLQASQIEAELLHKN